MGVPIIHVCFLLLLFIQIPVIAAVTNNDDLAALRALKDGWKNTPPNWVGVDPCGNSWDGINCSNTRVIFITLQSTGLKGRLSDGIGELSELQTLDLSYNNGLTGSLPVSIGNLTKLRNLIIIGCSFYGPIPDTIGSAKELNLLALNSNSFSGPIPPSIGYLSNLTWLDLSENQLSGSIPVFKGLEPGLDMLVHAKHFHFGNNRLSGTIPTQLFSSNMALLHVLFDSNRLTGSIPNTLGLVKSLEIVRLDRNSLTGPIPSNLNYLTNLTILILSYNQLTGPVPDFTGMNSLYFSLVGNPICDGIGVTEGYCGNVLQSNFSYLTPLNNCEQVSCDSNQICSPNCICAVPYSGILVFVAPFFPDLGNLSLYVSLSRLLMSRFQNLHVDSVSLSNPTRNSLDYLIVSLKVFPSGQDHFNQTDLYKIVTVLTEQILQPPSLFGPYYFTTRDVGNGVSAEHKLSIAFIIGAAAGCSVLVLLIFLAGVYAFRQKRKAERATANSNPFASRNPSTSRSSIPQLKGARLFSFEELKKCTNNFSEANELGFGGYGKVYKGTLPTRKLVAVKRAQQGSLQGGCEFKTEIELLSRVNHKNLVSLEGFCFEKGEQMLVYEYVPNGTLKDSLSGKSGIRLYWKRRLKVALGTARGLAYLHELVNPPIIHRDIKSNNILLDEYLNAKVSDFGISKPMVDSGKGYVTTQVKGTMGYLDPEYHETQQLTKKSDVYSFGVLMLELIIARKPIERGRYIVREVKTTMDKTKDLYNLHDILDPAISLGVTLGLESFVDLAMRCVEDLGADRPTMGEVVKEIENIMQLAGMNLINAESASTSASCQGASQGKFQHPYGNEAFFDYSGSFHIERERDPQ